MMKKFIITIISIFFLICTPVSAAHHKKHHHNIKRHIHRVAKTKSPITQTQPSHNNVTTKEPATFNQESFDSTEANSPYSQEALPVESEIESYSLKEEEWLEAQFNEEE